MAGLVSEKLFYAFKIESIATRISTSSDNGIGKKFFHISMGVYNYSS